MYLEILWKWFQLISTIFFCLFVRDWFACNQMLCGLRLIEGLCQGVIFPSTHTLLSKWAPVSERAQLATYCYSGSQFGTVVMLSTSGVLASSFMGWPSIFYISGLASGLWAILWLFFGSNSPADYKYISAEERDFIQSSLGQRTRFRDRWEEKSKNSMGWDFHIDAILFIGHCACSAQLGILDFAHRNADLHERCTQVRY